GQQLGGLLGQRDNWDGSGGSGNDGGNNGTSGSGGSSNGGGNNSSRSGASSSRGSGRRGLLQEQAAALSQLLRPPSVPGRELVLAQDILQLLFDDALEAAMALCFPACPAGGPQRAAARVECWRLYAEYTRGVLPLRRCDPLPASRLRHLADPGRMTPGAPMPDSPPPSWEPALAGGWLPCLERLLRRGSEGPAGPELVLSTSALFLQESATVEDCPMAWRHLAVLLAYGEPRQAAALVATLGKLLRAASPACLAVAASTGLATPAVALALMLSYAMCEWLPPLARLAARAIQAAELLAGAGSGGGGDPDDDGCGGWRQLLLEEAAGAAPALRRSGVAVASQPRFPWRPRLLQALARSLRAGGHGPVADCAEALAAVLQSWEAGGSVGAGGYQWLVPMLVPVAEARGALRTCSHPGCVSLAGDSEAAAEVGLLVCGRCGVARYCCADCQAAHLRAGHKKACGQRG
ncbi:hypothetical protein TSOC_010805, partial [Tetrabaena socialis]